MLIDGYFDKVYYRFWQTEKENANIFAIHGLGGHSLWFDSAGTLFNKNNINLFSYDLPAFGQSKYPKGIISSYNVWIDTTREVLEKFLIHFKISSPVFILGHSMGALIAILLSKKVRAHGWIISVAAFEGHPQTWPAMKFILPVLFKSVFKPMESIILPFGPELLTKNKATQIKVKQDPLRVINCSAKIFMHVYFLTLAAKRVVKFLTEPVLMLEARQDKVCSNAAMENYLNQIKAKDKTIKVYENSYHDLFIEDELNQIVEDISSWIRDRIT